MIIPDITDVLMSLFSFHLISREWTQQMSRRTFTAYSHQPLFIVFRMQNHRDSIRKAGCWFVRGGSNDGEALEPLLLIWVFPGVP
jgi:hypothetical protein